MIQVAVEVAQPFSTSQRGYRCTMVVIDCFSRWPEATIAEQKTDTLADDLIKEWVCRCKVPQEFKSDKVVSSLACSRKLL